MDFMGKTGAKIDFDKGQMALAVISRGLKKVGVSPSRQVALTVFPRDKEGHTSIPATSGGDGRWHEVKTRKLNAAQVAKLPALGS
jgi:hypothetical protein